MQGIDESAEKIGQRHFCVFNTKESRNRRSGALNRSKFSVLSSARNWVNSNGTIVLSAYLFMYLRSSKRDMLVEVNHFVNAGISLNGKT